MSVQGKDYGLETLLDLDGVIIDQGKGYWVKFEVHKVPPDEHRPHGLAYSLTLHDRYGTRILGFDNAHAVRPGKNQRYSGRIRQYDHYHRDSKDKGVAYEFKDACQLLEDFFARVDCLLKKVQADE